MPTIVTELGYGFKSGYRYITIEDHFRINGHRHLERAIAYASAGYPERYYQGSMQKALRNYKKADSLNLNACPILKPMIEFVGSMIIDHIMNGNKDTKLKGLIK